MSLALAQNPRAAHATIRGYTYQGLLTVVRWLAMADDELLICEAVEDLDQIVLGDGASTSFQDKRLSGRLSVRDAPVYKTLRGFLTSYVAIRERGSDRRFVFTCTAGMARQRAELDVLRRWSDQAAQPQLIEAIKTLLLSTAGDTIDEVQRAISWLNKADEWARWIGSVEWNLSAPDEVAVLEAIEEMARSHPGAEGVPPKAVRDRLFVEVIMASGKPAASDRQLDRSRLGTILGSLRGDLNAWIGTPESTTTARLLQPLALKSALAGEQQWRAGMPPASLLRAGYRVLPFDRRGREAALARLEEWCASDRSFDAILVVGDGGAGKTRLLLEVCETLSKDGWIAGFIRQTLLDQHIALLDWGSRDTLLVVDYAETRTRFLRELLRQIAAREGEPRKVRVVLVARRGPADSEWWEELLLSDSDLYDNLSHVGKLDLSPLYVERPGRLEAFRVACRLFRDRLGLEAGPSVSDPVLADDRFASPLYLQMTALATVLGTTGASPKKALDVVLQHEKLFWLRAVEAEAPPDSARSRYLFRVLGRCVALLTLTGGSPTPSACRELLATQTANDADLEWCVATLRSTYGVSSARGESYVSPLEPDVLGEHFLARSLAEDASLIRPAMAHSLSAAHMTLTVLNRLAAQAPHHERWLVDALADGSLPTLMIAMRVATEGGDPMGRILASVIEAQPAPERDEVLVEFIPQDTVALREFAEVAARNALALQINSASFPASRIKALNRHASYLRALGRLSDALIVVEAALAMPVDSEDIANSMFHARVSHARLLADMGRLAEGTAALAGALADKPRGLSELEEWNTLNEFGCLLSRVERFSEAMAVHRSNKDRLAGTIGVGLGREKYLVTTLINLAAALDQAGHPELALVEAQEATRLADEAAARTPDAFLPDLALALHVWTGVLGSLGRDDEVEPLLSRAVSIRTQLASARPRAFSYVLAGSLGNLSNLHGRRGELRTGLELSDKAIEQLRFIGELEPGAARSRLAQELSHRAAFLLELGRFDDAAATANEALLLYHQLASAGEVQWYRGAASALDRLVSALVLASRPSAAVDAARKFADGALAHAQEHQVASVARASALVSMSKCYGELGLVDPAYEPLLEASWRCLVALKENLQPRATGQMHLELAINALVLLARILNTRRQFGSACVLLTLALSLSAGYPSITSIRRADAVLCLVANLDELEAEGMSDVDASHAVVTSLDSLAAAHLSDDLLDLVDIGLRRMHRLRENGDLEQSLKFGVGLLPIATRLGYRDDCLLNGIGFCLTLLGRHTQAVVASALAVDAARTRWLLALEGASVLASALQSYAVDLVRVGDLDAALSAFREAATLQSSLLARGPRHEHLVDLLHFYRRAAEDAGVEIPREVVDPLEGWLWAHRLLAGEAQFNWDPDILAPRPARLDLRHYTAIGRRGSVSDDGDDPS